MKLTQICFSPLVAESWRCRAESLFSYLQAGERAANGKMWFDKDLVELNHLDVPAQNEQKDHINIFLRLESRHSVCDAL